MKFFSIVSKIVKVMNAYQIAIDQLLSVKPTAHARRIVLMAVQVNIHIHHFEIS